MFHVEHSITKYQLFHVEQLENVPRGIKNVSRGTFFCEIVFTKNVKSGIIVE